MSNSINIVNISKKYNIYDKKSHYFSELLPDLAKKFLNFQHGKEIWVLKDLDFTVKQGERLGIIGENGTGKSTLLKIICKYIQPNQGQVNVEGKVHSLLNLGAGFLPNLNALQNIEAYFAYNNVPLNKNIIEDIIEFAELGAYTLQPIKVYSSGMFARFAFSVMTAIKPNILIIDEILGAGDAYFLGKCIERLNTLTNDTKMTLLIVSHDMSSIQQICSRVLWLHKGEIKANGAPLDVIKEFQAHIRKKENIRLIEKQKKLPYNTLQPKEELRDITFRIIADPPLKVSSQGDIYQISIEGEDFSELIQVGKVFDNDLNQVFSIVEAPGKTDWGVPKKDNHGYYRQCIASNSQYQHSPFILKASPALRSNLSDKKLTIRVAYKSEVNLLIQVYNEKNKIYDLIGVLPNTNLSFKETSIEFVLPQLEAFSLIEENAVENPIVNPLNEEQIHSTNNYINQEEPPKIEEKDNYSIDKNQYGSKEIIIEDVTILDQNNQHIRVLYPKERYTVRIYYKSEQHIIINPVFVFCIYTTEGICVSQFLQATEELGTHSISGRGYIDFNLSKLYIGAKDYVASAAIFKRKNNNKCEPEAYHVLDRCIFFKVEDLISTYERGVCLQPYKVKLYA